MEKFDVVIIGSGPGGYVAAIRAGQLGLKAAIVEKDPDLGGTCLNIGCIPSKAMLTSSDHFDFAKKEAGKHGIVIGDVSMDLSKLLQRKDKVVKTLTGGVRALMKTNKVTTFEGTGTITAPGKVSVKNGAGQTAIETANIVIATGSVPVELPFAKFDGQTIVCSTEALSFTEVPKRLLVIGAGAIGLELGSVWNRLGSEVTMLEFLPRVALGFDLELSNLLQRALTAQGMTFHLETKVTGVKVENGRATVTATKGGGEEVSFEADKVLVSVGRRPFSEGVGADKVGVEYDDKRRIKVDEHFQTNIKGIYAIGDVIRGPMLAHKAEEEGIACVENITGKSGHVNYDIIPSIIYTNPELAGVGLTEDQAKEKGIEVRIGKFPFRANGRALANEDLEGMVKFVADAKTDRILGAHILQHAASELIAEPASVMEFGGSSEDLGRTTHAHPTLSEAVKEAALAVEKRALHIVNR